MKSLNGFAPLPDHGSNRSRSTSQYWEIYPVSEGNSLLLHLLTGAIDLVTNEEADQIRTALTSRNVEVLPPDMLRALEERGYFADSLAEQAFIDALAERHQEQLAHKPIEFFVTTTYGCPVGCSYCFEGELTRQAQRTAISSEQIASMFAAIEEITKVKNRSVREIVLFGGEPLLPKTMDAVREILIGATERGHHVTVCTSGIFCQDFAPLFHEFAQTVTLVRVTIDGPRRYHDALRTLPDAFDRATDGINALLDRGLRVMTRTNVGKQNLETLPELADFFRDSGWLDNDRFDAIVTGIKDRACVGDKGTILREDELAVRFLQMRAKHDAVRRLRPLNIFMSLRHLATNLGHLDGIVKLKEAVAPLETIKFHGCGATDGTLYILGTDNCVYTCTESIGKPVLSVGTYHPTLALDPKRLRQWEGWHKYRIPKCRECKYLLICGGTCTLSSVVQFGSGKDPICPPIPQILGGYVSALTERIAIV